MSVRILVAYATRYGSTQEVAEAVAQTLSKGGVVADVELARQVRTLAGYSAVVLGAPLMMYRWHKDALKFLARFRDALAGRPVAVFALGPVHDPHDEEEWQNSRDQLDKELAQIPWFRPAAMQLFGGKFDPELLRFPVKQLARGEPATDIRNWEAIRAWADSVRPVLMGSDVPQP